MNGSASFVPLTFMFWPSQSIPFRRYHANRVGERELHCFGVRQIGGTEQRQKIERIGEDGPHCLGVPCV